MPYYLTSYCSRQLFTSNKTGVIKSQRQFSPPLVNTTVCLFTCDLPRGSFYDRGVLSRKLCRKADLLLLLSGQEESLLQKLERVYQYR